MNSCTLELPYPPTVNRMYAENVVYSKKMRKHVSVKFKTDRGKQYCHDVYYLVRQQGKPAFGTARLKVTVEVFPPDNRERDLGNLDKALMDALQEAGVYVKDEQIDDHRFIRRSVHPNGKVIVHIESQQSQLF